MTIAPLRPTGTTDVDMFDAPVPFELAYRMLIAVWVFDVDNSRVVQANAAACRLWQAADEEELGARDFSADMSKTVAKRLKQYQSDFKMSDANFTELWTLYPNGEPQSIMVNFRGYLLEDGRMGMLCEATDDTQVQPQNMRSAEALLHTDVMITLFSKDGPPLYLNPAARNAFDGQIEDFGSIFTNLADYDDLMANVEALGEDRRVAMIKTEMGTRWYDISAKTCLDAVTGSPAILLTAIDVSELKEARDTARHLADRDQLTNLHNRAYLNAYLSDLTKQEDLQECAIVFFDVDRFKLINDRYGHEAGDTVLKQIAMRTRALLRSTDMVARLGGDEFVVLIENATDVAALTRKIDQVRTAISRPILHGTTRIDASVSVGVSVFHPTKARHVTGWKWS